MIAVYVVYDLSHEIFIAASFQGMMQVIDMGNWRLLLDCRRLTSHVSRLTSRHRSFRLRSMTGALTMDVLNICMGFNFLI